MGSINLEMRAQTMGVYFVGAERLILARRFTCQLKGDNHLVPFLLLAARHLGLDADLLTSDDARFGKFISSALRRKRLWLDAAYCRLAQQCFAQLCDQPLSSGMSRDVRADWPCSLITQVFADASPRSGKEWLLSEVRHLQLNELAHFCEIARSLEAGLSTAPEVRDEAHSCAHTDSMHSMHRHLTMPPVALGVGQSVRARKVLCLATHSSSQC